MHFCLHRRKIHTLLPIFKRLFSVSIPTKFQEKIDQTLDNRPLSWLDDSIVVPEGSKQKHMDELKDVLTKLENAVYKL